MLLNSLLKIFFKPFSGMTLRLIVHENMSSENILIIWMWMVKLLLMDQFIRQNTMEEIAEKLLVGSEQCLMNYCVVGTIGLDLYLLVVKWCVYMFPWRLFSCLDWIQSARLVVPSSALCLIVCVGGLMEISIIIHGQQTRVKKMIMYPVNYQGGYYAF